MGRVEGVGGQQVMKPFDIQIEESFIEPIHPFELN